MINKIFLSILNILINIFDHPNKQKVIKFFKNYFGKKDLTIIDIGAHKGETIDLFIDNFHISNIIAFEPNTKLYHQLKKKYHNKKLLLFNNGVGIKYEQRELNIMQDSSSSTFNELNKDTNYYKKKQKILNLFSSKNDLVRNKEKVLILNLSEVILKNNINSIDILKIDTEGFEFNVLQGLGINEFRKIKIIYFEHHYDLMIKKGYKFSDINDLLNKNNFYKKYKIKMSFRKSFEYIYENSQK